MQVMKFIVVGMLCLAAWGCKNVYDQNEGLPCESVPCETAAQCPDLGIECVAAVCVDECCEYVNLATTDELPVDPDSGLPLGKGCQGECQ